MVTNMQGFLVQNSQGDYLSKDYYWFPHDSWLESRVHSTESLRAIDWSHWPMQPELFTEASYSPESGVRLCTRVFDLQQFEEYLEDL